MNQRILAPVVVALSLCASAAAADEPVPASSPAPEAAPVTPAPAGPTAAEKKAKYALPFALRPAIAPNLVRIDLGVASTESTAGTTTIKASVVSSILTAGYKPIAAVPDLGFYARAAFVSYSPDPGNAATAFSNPLFFAMYTPEIAPKLRLPVFAGVTAAIGSGGGGSADLDKRAAIGSGIYARQAMDNALFATNYMTPTVGAGLAWIDKGWTVQGEATVLFLRRVRGDNLDADSSRTNFTTGLNVGYLALPPFLTVSLELHYQRWLSTPLGVERDEAKPEDQRLGLRDQLTFGGGLRGNIPLDKSILIRPGISYFRGIDKPMSEQKFSIIQIDVPVAF